MAVMKNPAICIAGIFCALAASAHAASISGTLSPPGKVKSVKAFQRFGATITAIKNTYYSGTIDPKTGRFTIPNLPDGTYQLLLDCGDATIEGVDLAIDGESEKPTFDYTAKTRTLATQRVDLSAVLDPDEAVTPEKKAELTAKAVGLPKLLEKLADLAQVDRFADHFRPLYVHGAGDRAFALVELARLRDFYAGKGQAIYRVEIWPLERVGDVWNVPTQGVRVLQRHRLDHDAFLKLGAFFEPKLGGLRVEKGKDLADVNYAVPQAWDDALGKVPGRDVPKPAEEPKQDKDQTQHPTSNIQHPTSNAE